MKNKYIPAPGAIVEMVCSLAAVLLLFTTWIKGFADGEIIDKFPTTIDLLKDIGPEMVLVKVTIVLFFVNIILKFFDRSAWLSGICALLNGYFVVLVNKMVFDFNHSAVLMLSDGSVNLSGMGVIAIFVEIAFAIAVFVRFVSWLVELYNKRGGKPFVVAMAAWLMICIALLGMMFVALKHNGYSEDDPAHAGLYMLGMLSALTFFIFIIVGIVKWFQIKKQEKMALQAATGDETAVADIENDNTAEGTPEPEQEQEKEQEQEPGHITLRQILLFAIVGLIFTPMPYILDRSFKEDSNKNSVVVDTAEAESILEEDMSVEPDAGMGSDYATEQTAEEETAGPESSDFTTDSYVTITGVNVRLRTTPEINESNIITDSSGKNVHPNKGESLKCVGEEGDFYLVLYRGDYVYVSKKFAVLK